VVWLRPGHRCYSRGDVAAGAGGLGGVAAAAAAVQQTRRDYRPLEVLKTPPFWVMYVMFVMVAAGGLMAVAQLALIAKDYKVDTIPVTILG
jgi:MFS transporter, OFA family, oxalate/formate antiporter